MEVPGDIGVGEEIERLFERIELGLAEQNTGRVKATDFHAALFAGGLPQQFHEVALQCRQINGLKEM